MAELTVTPADYPPWLKAETAADLSPWLIREHCTKVCGRCGERKTLSEYHRLSTSSDGRHSYCKVCRKGGV